MTDAFLTVESGLTSDFLVGLIAALDSLVFAILDLCDVLVGDGYCMKKLV